MKARFIYLILLVSCSFTACQKDTIWVYYDETYCSDKWGDSDVPDNKKIKNVKKYLKSKEISVFKIEISYTGAYEICQACTCKSGNVIKCKISETDLQKSINENFYK